MVAKQQIFCTEKQVYVEALVQELPRRTKGTATHTILSCAEAARCPRTVFCRFVNPLTTRNPLELPAEAPAGD